jgi:hypothetical protein
MPPTIRSGNLATNEVLAAQLVIDMGTEVMQYDPPGAPMMKIITKRMGADPADATTVRWMEDEPMPYWDQLNGAITNVQTTITVDNGSYFRAGDLVKIVTTDEVIRVTAVAGNDLTVTRAWAGTAAAAADNAYLLNLSTAEMEGDVAPEARHTVKVERTNFTQIVKHTVHITGTNEAVKHYHGSERRYQQRKVGEEHARRWEEIALHGRKKEDTSTGAKPIRSAGGLDETITTNVTDLAGTMTESEFIDIVSDAFRYSVRPGRTRKILLASSNVINTINSWGLAKLQVNEKASATYGMDISTYIAGSARLEVVDHPLLELGYEGYFYIVDPDGMKYRPLRGRGTKLRQNIQDNSEDGTKDEFITEATFQFSLDKVHAKGYGVSF